MAPGQENLVQLVQHTDDDTPNDDHKQGTGAGYAEDDPQSYSDACEHASVGELVPRRRYQIDGERLCPTDEKNNQGGAKKCRPDDSRIA